MQNKKTNVLTFKDLMPDAQFIQERPRIIQEIIALKRHRRMVLGPHMTVLFESRRLVWWQVQEMLRVEKGGAAQAEEELRVYNPLIPSPLRLTATLMIEIADPVVREKTLANLSGLEGYISLEIDSVRVPAQTVCVDGNPSFSAEVQEGPTSSVHFLSFSFTQDQKDAFVQHQPSLVCDHPLYAYSQPLPQDLWTQLKEDD